MQAARYVSVSELYSTDEVELLLDEIRDLEPTSCRGEDIQDFEIAGSGAGAAGAGGGAGGGGGAAGGAGSGARSPAGTERSWDSHAHYSRAPPAPPRPLAPVYCRLRYLLTATGSFTLLLVVLSVCCAACVWAGAGLRVWALPGAGGVRALQLGALTSAALHAALLALHVTRLRALLPLRWAALRAAAALWSGAALLAGAAATAHALRGPAYRRAPRLAALLTAAAGFGLGAALAALVLAALGLRGCARRGACAGAGGAGAAGAGGAGGAGRARGSAGSLAAYRAVPQPSTSRHDPL